jgi:oligoendopeptidase F
MATTAAHGGLESELETELSADSISGPSWNNSSEYPSLTSNEYAYDQHQLDSLFGRITALVEACAPMMKDEVADHSMLIPSLQAITEMEETSWKILFSMRTYAYCLNCIDGSEIEAQKALSKLESFAGRLEAVTKPVHVYLTLAPEEILKSYLDHAHTKPFEFQIRERRKFADTLLSEKEEALIARLRANGPASWGTLYNQMSSNARCHMRDPKTGEVKELGLAQASGLLRDGNEAVRKAAWQSIQEAWRQLAIPAASGLNALAGWRIELADLRSKNRPVHYLEEALRRSKIEKATLDAMMSAIQENIEIPRRALRAMAHVQGKEKLDPWDLLAPAPLGDHAEKIPFLRGLNLIRESFAGVDTTLADFVDTMKKNRWIEGRSDLPKKRQGAFCTSFPKSRTPRVFQTFMGSLDDVRTLAHELGHAYHTWVMRDLPLAKTSYPMTLAETASIFAESAFADGMLEKAKQAGDSATVFDIAYQNGESAAAFLLNIPARFDFETSFYDKRQEGFVSPEELSTLTANAWEKWYGDTLSEPDRQFWMTKLHFSMSGISFYNFPYSFGYLFSLGVYALRQEKGNDFWASYNALLRDTGSLSAEDLAMQHLGVDLTKPDFWRKSLAIVDAQVRELEEIVAQRKAPRHLGH